METHRTFSVRYTSYSSFYFSDDFLLLAEASCEQAEVVTKALHNFCNISGEKVNKEITQIYFSKNVKQHSSKYG